jgi:succinate dehydrogenase/fumarate reductase flavoprotein subunit
MKKQCGGMAAGDGLDLAAEFGAKLVNMEQNQIHPTKAAGSTILPAHERDYEIGSRPHEHRFAEPRRQ